MFDPIGGVIRIKNTRTRQSVYLNGRDLEITANLVMAQLERLVFENVSLQADFIRGDKFAITEIVISDDKHDQLTVVAEAERLDANLYPLTATDVDVELVQSEISERKINIQKAKRELDALRQRMHFINCPKCSKSIPSWKIGVHVCKVESAPKRRTTVYRYS